MVKNLFPKCRYFIYTECGFDELDEKEFYYQKNCDDLPPYFEVLLPGFIARCIVTQNFSESFGSMLNRVSRACCNLDYVSE